MELELVMTAVGNVFEPETFITMIVGVVLGVLIGALPGLTATMGVALLLPLTFGMAPLPGLLVLISVFFGAIYGGSIPAILLKTPGTPAAAVTVIDGYELTKQGLGGRAMSISIVSAVFGGLFSTTVLILVAPQLAQVALRFNSPEYFALALFGLSIIISLSSTASLSKGIMVGLFGILISMIGVDPIIGVARFTFGNINLLGGLSFIPILIGIFAFAQVLVMIEELFMGKRSDPPMKIKSVFPRLSDLNRCKWTMLRSATFGSLMGAMPGVGADISAYISYNEERRWSKHRENMGNGEIAGVAAPETANSATAGGSFIPLLTLGIPGDAVTAVILGALVMQGVRPGPALFTEQRELLYSIFSGMIVSNLLLLVVAFIGLRFFIKILSIKKEFLIPAVVVLCVIGAFAINNNIFDVWVMLIMGFIWYAVGKFGFPQSPLIIALILGPMAEREFRRSLVLSNGSYSIFWESPIVVVLVTLAMITLFMPVLKPIFLKIFKPAKPASNGGQDNE
ncbi:MAG: tripartite tricarboxylate transporter permease [Defluviitaleaceae bacterium]|nr:tripartite tricarboxylate transporter permease [Defluviitaleaceae bacterium]